MMQWLCALQETPPPRRTATALFLPSCPPPPPPPSHPIGMLVGREMSWGPLLPLPGPPQALDARVLVPKGTAWGAGSRARAWDEADRAEPQNPDPSGSSPI